MAAPSGCSRSRFVRRRKSRSAFGHARAWCKMAPPMSTPIRRQYLEIKRHHPDAKANNYLAALAVERERARLAYADITTGEFCTTQLSVERALAEIERLGPAELLLPEGLEIAAPAARARTSQPAWRFRPDTGR